MTVSASDFRSAMRQMAAAVNIITTVHEGRRAGMTATAVMALTAEPAQVAVAVNRANASFAAMAASGVFAVNILPHGAAFLASVFAGAKDLSGAERFAHGSWDTLVTGAPILADSVASFDCRIVETVGFSSHELLVGEVVATRLSPGGSPLLYIDGSWANIVRTTDAEFDAYGRLIDTVSDALDMAIGSAASPREQLCAFSRGFAALSVESADVLRHFHLQEIFIPASRLEAINARKREVEAKIRALLIRGAEAGEFDVVDPAITTDAIIGMLNSVHRFPDLAAQDSGAAVGRTFGDMVIAMVSRR
ncbi:MAG: flavin reductase [Rhizobiaceae bacterium]